MFIQLILAPSMWSEQIQTTYHKDVFSLSCSWPMCFSIGSFKKVEFKGYILRFKVEIKVKANLIS